MKIYTIIGGVNGAGKSSLTGAIKARTNLGKIIDVDKLAKESKISGLEAGKRAVTLIDDCLKKGVSFTQETTLSGTKTLNTVQKARELGYTIRLFYVGLDTAEECLKRIKNRVARGGHDIGTEDVLRRFDSRFESLIKILPYCDEVTFFDNDNGFVGVAEYKNGDLIKIGKTPKWICELSDTLTGDIK